MATFTVFAHIQHVEWVKNTGAANPQYRITYSTGMGTDRQSVSALTRANAAWAWNIDPDHYNRGYAKRARIELTRDGSLNYTRERITAFAEEDEQ